MISDDINIKSAYFANSTNKGVTRPAESDFARLISEQNEQNLNAIQNTPNTPDIANFAYGYSVDSNGFMGTDFNVAAGLPQSFKVHSSTLKAMQQSNALNYQNIDFAHTFKQYYNIFDTLTQSVFPADKTNFTQADIQALPKAFSATGVVYDEFGLNYEKAQIVKSYNDSQTQQARELRTHFNAIGVDFDYQEISFEILDDYASANNFFAPNMSVYASDNSDGVSKEALFVNFIKRNFSGLVLSGGNTQLTRQTLKENQQIIKESFLNHYARLNFSQINNDGFNFSQWLKANLKAQYFTLSLDEHFNQALFLRFQQLFNKIQ